MNAFTYSIILLLILSLGSCKDQVKPQNKLKKTETAEQLVNYDSSSVQVVFLGTGTPIADPTRSGPSVAVIVKGTPHIVDLGPGVVRRASGAYQKGIKALRVTNLKTVFLTHLHSDHTLGYADMIFTPWVLGRGEPLKVFGPKGTKDMTENLLKAYQKDIDVRINGYEPADTVGYKVNVTEIEEGLVYQDSNLTVSAIQVKHTSWDYAYAFKFVTSEKTIVISGDCIPSEKLIAESIGCDILVHEVYSKAGFDGRKPDWQYYHKRSHTSGPELGKIAEKIKPGKLILYHQLLWGATEEELINEIKQFYSGTVVYANDLDVY